MRHPLTHADERDDLAFEVDTRPLVSRMQEAGYDVLFNKAEWRNASTTRRETIKHLAGSMPGGIFTVEGSEITIVTQLLDGFGTFPVDLSAGLNALPAGWWAKFPDDAPSLRESTPV